MFKFESFLGLLCQSILLPFPGLRDCADMWEQHATMKYSFIWLYALKLAS